MAIIDSARAQYDRWRGTCDGCPAKAVTTLHRGTSTLRVCAHHRDAILGSKDGWTEREDAHA